MFINKASQGGPTNNSSSVIAGYYLNAVEKYGKYFVVSFVSIYFTTSVFTIGCTRMLRGDRGTENSRIAYLQPFLRRNRSGAENSFQYNMGGLQVIRFAYLSAFTWRFIIIVCFISQRIEAWWSQLRRSFTDWWLKFFQV